MAKKTLPKKVTTEVKSYLQILKNDGFNVQSAIVFGSSATGKATAWSDIDVCIISNDLKKKKWPLEYLWVKTAQLKKNRIEPVGFTTKDFIDESPLVWEIKKTGISVQ